jgi:hypothetical protein
LVHQEKPMSTEHLPRIRVIATPVANIVMLHAIGQRLRSVYDDVIESPVPHRLEALARALPSLVAPASSARRVEP